MCGFKECLLDHVMYSLLNMMAMQYGMLLCAIFFSRQGWTRGWHVSQDKMHIIHPLHLLVSLSANDESTETQTLALD